jgi:hypothetical protein
MPAVVRTDGRLRRLGAAVTDDRPMPQRRLTEKTAALQPWQANYAAMVSKKNEEIQRLKWLYRITPIDKIEKPRPKGRG